MIRSRLGLKALGLCALVLGVTAFAGTARAETGAAWLILLGNKQEKKTAGELLAGIQVRELDNYTYEDLESKTLLARVVILLTKVLTKKVYILCTGMSLLGVGLEANGGITEGGKVQFSGCETKIDLMTQAACQPKSAGAGAGTIVTNEVKGLLVLHTGGVGLTRIEPKVGETLAAIELGATCSIGESLPVSGKLFLKDIFLTILSVDHEVVEGPLTDLWVLNKNAEHTTTLDGRAILILNGAHTGLQWAGFRG